MTEVLYSEPPCRVNGLNSMLIYVWRYLEAVSRNDAHVSWYPVTKLDLYDVTNDQFLCVDIQFLSVTNHDSILHSTKPTRLEGYYAAILQATLCILRVRLHLQAMG